MNFFLGTAAQSQTNSYKQTNLVSDPSPQPAVAAAHTNNNLVNPWGIAFAPGAPFWISENASPTGVTTLYDRNGNAMGTFTIPPPTGSSNPATPTGIVVNSAATGFGLQGTSSQFIFDTEDGTISGWTGGASAILAVDNSKNPTAAMGAVYKGLALITTNTGAFLLATNFRSGQVEVYNSNFQLVTLSGNFSDPNPPALPAGVTSPGYAPFGIHVVTVNNAQLVAVTYALQDPTDNGLGPDHDPIHLAGAGFVDFYNLDGTLNQRVATGGTLNAPWGVVIPPSTFGAFGSDLVVGNFGDGTISAFNLQNGNAFVDQMRDSTGAVITNLSMWDMVFDPSGNTGNTNTMYITAGLSNESHGVFAAITANSAASPPSADFTISGPTTTVTFAAGTTGMFNVTLGGLNGFNSSVNLTCSGGPLGSTCTVTPASVSPPSGGTITAAVSIATSSNPYKPAAIMGHATGSGMLALLLSVAGMGLFGVVVTGTLLKEIRPGLKWTPSFATDLGLLFAIAFLLAAAGCGYNSHSTANGTQRGNATITITGTSGNLSHSATVNITVQ